MTDLSRAAAGGSLIAAGATTVELQSNVRAFEAHTFASWVNRVGAPFGPARTTVSVVFVHSGPSSLTGLDITPECTSAFLIAPLLLLAGAMVVFARKRSTLRITAAAAVAAVVMFTANQLRIAMIAEFVRRWGMGEGYPIAHRVLGSLLILVAAVTAYVLYFVFVCRGRRTAPAARS